MDFDNTFIWNELMTNDIGKAKAFYAAVAGWTYVDVPMPDGDTYVLARPPGASRDVAGLMAWPKDQPGAEDWMPYLGVLDIKATLAAVEKAGGTIIRPVFEVPGTGLIAIATDANGTALGFLQPEPM